MSFLALVRALRAMITLPALAFSVAALLPAASHAQNVQWRGLGYLFNFSPGCSVYGWQGSSLYTVRFLPSGIGGNGDSSRLALFDRFSAYAFRLPTGRFNRTWQVVDAGAIYAAIGTWPPGTQIRITTQTPGNAALNATTPQIRLVGAIRGLDALPDCTASFEATLLLVPH